MAKDPSERYQTPQEMLDASTAFQPLGSGAGSPTLVDQKIEPLPLGPCPTKDPKNRRFRSSVPDPQASSAHPEPVGLEETQPISAA